MNTNPVKLNEAIHDRIANAYQKRHGEIFNEIEQSRLRSSLSRAIAAIDGSSRTSAFDFGCGSGNLTRHLVDLGFTVTAADISSKFLEIVASKFSPENVKLHKIQDNSISEIADSSFDFVSTYSVLHHIPDYLEAVRQLSRICRPGGVLYIDHEACPSFWLDDGSSLKRYYARAALPRPEKYLNIDNYIGKVRRLFDPKFANEGDIHVWPDDHIEWDEIVNTLRCNGFEPVMCQDYLLFRSYHRLELYERNSGSLQDTRVMAFRRRVC